MAEPKACDYSIQFVDSGIKTIFELAYGIEIIVEKTRSLWLWENVRIHLDSVDGLGTFIEFEAVLSEQYDEADGFNKLAFLQKIFGIENDDILEVSYAELISQKKSA